jgi:hypothetical protein
MSWSASFTSMTVESAKRSVNEGQTPDGIKGYILAGIDHLASKHGPDVLISATLFGHLGTEGSLEETTATVKVSKA